MQLFYATVVKETIHQISKNAFDVSVFINSYITVWIIFGPQNICNFFNKGICECDFYSNYHLWTV